MVFIPSCREEADSDGAWDALEGIARRIANDHSLPLLLPCDFGYWGCYDHPRLPRVFEFKHMESGRWLQCTSDGRIAWPERGRLLKTKAALRATAERLRLAECGGRLPLDHYCGDFCRPLLDRRCAMAARVKRS